jgi:hypothetical protein
LGWSDMPDEEPWFYCPACGNTKTQGHKRDCFLMAALATPPVAAADVAGEETTE